MKITEVRIFPTESRDGKLKAFATMTFDDWFVVRNVKVIQGNNGLFVAMPSRKAMDSCPKCRTKNARGSNFCNECGAKLPPAPRESAEEEKKQGAHMDIAHPITQECRVYLQEEILKEYGKESGKAASAGNAPEKIAREETEPAAEPAKAGETVDETDAGREERPAAPAVDEGQDIEL
ncbi:MAG: hypothetical protein GF408_07725 [Candidatus Omnitrophica bacterium]|nr:hypothetical protein [Candidatus Omnitrophota bacterium]